ncbi:retrovirus-related pol polyprotein from transposon TNT 1-94 [Tanacetum coccineum]|uniref:Retrovirus-related pol polyprotein from transposon TNT 1-94 n=1 Tax=Tanacetum coccineum TaxID=301880 RepID=A0ABQ5DVB9_9ASTR
MAKASPTQAWLWHRRLSHLNFDYITLLSKKDIVTGLPKLTYVKDQLCSSCEMSKAKRSSLSQKLFKMPECYGTRTLMLISKKKALNIRLPLLEHLNRTALSKDKPTLVEAARTMLSASKLPLSFWAEAVATACYTQNRSIIISTHGKTAYHIINDRKPSIKHLHIFGCICYITRDGENLDKMKEKGDPCSCGIFYSSKDVFRPAPPHKRRLLKKSLRSSFLNGQKLRLYNSDPVPPRQNVVPTTKTTDSSQQGLEFLFSPLLEEYYNPIHGHAEDNNNDQASNASFQEAEFINPFCTRVQEIGESSSRNIDNTDVHSFVPQSQDYRWTRDHPLEQVRGNPTMPVQTRQQFTTDPEMCMFVLTVSIVEPKNIKEAMADSALLRTMQDETSSVRPTKSLGTCRQTLWQDD